VVFRGKDLFTELADLPWMGLLLYGITGRIMDEKQIRLFEGIWSLCTSYPDPRLWNNRVAALAGTARSTGALGVSAATAITEAKIYGGQPIIAAFKFIKKAKTTSRTSLTKLVREELTKNRLIPGFGRPLAGQDERIVPLMNLAKQLGFHNGPHTKLVFEIERILLAGRWRQNMNIAGLAAALALDQGLDAHEYTSYLVLAFSAGMVPCYLDATQKPEGSFFPLRCDRISYEGPEPREWN
jgi:hypothetical protein